MIDLSKTYRTRDGRAVKLLMVDGGGTHPIVGAINDDTCWNATNWRSDGSSLSSIETRFDLIEVKPRIKREAWVNVYANTTEIFDNREAAHEAAWGDLSACVKITIDCEHGEGLS